MTTKSELDREVAKAEEALKQAKIARRMFQELTPTQQLAEILHGLLCHYNHIDMCGWGYENWQKGGYAHDEYLKKAQNVIKYSGDTAQDIEVAVKIIKAAVGRN